MGVYLDQPEGSLRQGGCVWAKPADLEALKKSAA